MRRRTTRGVAARDGSIEVLEYLKSKGMLDMINEPDDYGYTPLHDAVRLKQKEAARWLMEHAANINAITKYGFTVFAIACGVMSLSFVEELAGKVAPDHLALPNNYDVSPMRFAFVRDADLDDDLLIVRLLILRGVPVRAQDFPAFFTESLPRRRQILEA